VINTVDCPWPWPQLPFADPPWELHCDILTVWFRTDVDALRPYLHHDLLPLGHSALARARFYTIVARTPQGDLPFKELTLGVRDPAGRAGTEIAFAMWTDSWKYLCWGREHFGWPLTYAEINIPDAFYRTSGLTASIPDAGISAQLQAVGPRVEVSAPASWVTPRRRLLTTGPSEEMLLVRPEVISSGTTHQVEVSVNLGEWFPQPTWGDSLVTYGAMLRVGRDVLIEQR
jgi:hypothetical protein